MCVYVPSNTTVILDGVYLLALSYMFRPLLGHHQAFWRYVILVHCFYIILHLHVYYQLHCYKRSLVLVLQGSLGSSVVFGGGRVEFLLLHSFGCGFLLTVYFCCRSYCLIVWFHVVFLLRTHGIPGLLVFLFEDGVALICVMQVGDNTVSFHNISHVNLGMRGVCYVLLMFFGHCITPEYQ
jgi:hypothetical protein